MKHDKMLLQRRLVVPNNRRSHTKNRIEIRIMYKSFFYQIPQDA